ncbi:glycosyltransferase 61 family protein [Limnospira fusiformis]
MGEGFGIALFWGVSELVSDLVRGNQLLRSGKLEEAVDAFQKAIALHPHFHWSYYKLGQALEKLGHMEEARVAYQKATDLNPSLDKFAPELESVNSIENSDINSSERLAKKIYGQLPTSTFSSLLPVDNQSFLSDVDCFRILIETIKPQIIIEVGSWKGHSAILMAQNLRDLNLNSSRVLCVDTWLGSLEHWEKEVWRNQLYLKHGYPSLYERFLSNVIRSGLKDYIIPFPMVSATAAAFFDRNEIKADLIYIDAAHDYESVTNDLHNFYPLLSQGGIIFGDDFPHPPTGNAIRDFAISKNLGIITQGRKCILLRNDQLSKFANHKSLNLVLEPQSINKNKIKLSPMAIDSSEIVIAENENLLFAAEEEKVYIYKPNSDENVTNFGVDNIIQKACFDSSVKTSKFQSIIYTPKPVYLARFPWALVLPSSPSLVISRMKKYWQDSLYLVNWQALSDQSDKGILMLTEDIKPRIINEPTILLAAGFAYNYYHWHTQLLPVAYYLKTKINSGKFRVISHDLNNWQKRSLQLLGIDLSALEPVGNETLLCRSLVYSSYLSGIAFVLPPQIKKVFDSVKDYYWENVKNPIKDLPELIFISREDQPSRRKLLNEYEVFSALEKLGFVKVTPGRLSYEQQIQTFANAKVIVSPHGAGLTNIVFASSNCTVIEIFPENYINICYWRLSQVLNHKYAYIVAEVDEAQKHLHHSKTECSVSVDAVVNAVSHVLV